jgi:chromosome segregation ATPase
MRIRAIRLKNVRRFVDPVEIGGIGPGLNVLSAPNEQGKSTVFDGLHALFFKDAKSWDKDIRALVPHAGGDPWIEVDLEHAGAHYRIAKQFFKTAGKGEVRVWQEDRLLHQADAAENWLKTLIKPPKDGGPSGLLWVRQGLTSFEDAKETQQARRDLLSSVAGEVDMVTGGQRMDAICRKVQSALDQLVTKRGAKKGGALDLAEREVADLQDRHDVLSAQVRELRELLENRRGLRAEQVELDDPEERTLREERLEAARAALEAASRHQDQLTRAGHAVQLAETLLENHARKVDILSQPLKEMEDARVAHATAIDEERIARGALEAPTARLQALSEQVGAARAKAKAARQALDRALQATAAAQADELRRELTERIDKAQAQIAVIKAQAKPALTGPDQTMMQRIEAAQMAYALAVQAHQGAAAAVTVHYETAAGAVLELNGQSVEDKVRYPLPDGGRIEVPGVAVIDIQPAQVDGVETVQKTEAELQDALAQVGYPTMEEARAAFDRRLAAAGQRQEAEALLAVLAPEGVEALRRQLAGLPTGPSDEQGAADQPEVLDRAAADAFCRAAEGAVDRLVAEQEALRSVADAARLAAETARSRLEAAAQRLDRARTAVGDEEESKASLDALATELPDLQKDLSQAQTTEAALRRAAPDMALVEATLKRAISAHETARQRSQEILRDLAVLDARISAHASAAVEEELAETEDHLARAKKRLDAVKFEVAVQKRLLSALEVARSGAKEHYVGPVMAELKPLLRMLWPEARLTVDADQVLPEGLERHGESADFDSLSGGTQEQIALLVRLAFARLLAKAGTPAPVILDDAIVYTDDARIEKIFDALTLQADDVQILVFTCRQKAFRSLGGTPISIRSVDSRG